MSWKWLFLLFLAVGFAILWQSEVRRRQFFGEVQQARRFINNLTSRYEGWQVLFLSVGTTLILTSVYSFLFRENEALWPRSKRTFFRLLRKLPGVQAKIDKELEKNMKTIEVESFSVKRGIKTRLVLPKKGLSSEEVLKELTYLATISEIKWEKGYVSGALYNCSPDLTSLSAKVFEMFVWSNPLHQDIFPSVRRMEAEVVQWTVDLFNGSKDACGLMTSGGTESILVAMLAYRQIGYDRGIEYPEIVCPTSVHCAFNKAAEYFRMKITQVPLDPRTRKVNVKAMAKAISRNTVVLVGSAPHFPYGIIDPIEDIGKLACKYGIGMHVDCCLGGFIVPFMERAGFQMEPFDFRVKGVTSISADTHKYGFTPKGTSVVMYANKNLRHKQIFVCSDWQGGIYATPTLAGSRAGALVATTWATLVHTGEDGYVESTKKIITTARKIISDLTNVPGLYVMGSPKVSVIAFGSNDFDIYRLFVALSKKGWALNNLQFPPSFHICLTMLHTKDGVAERFVKDVKACTKEIMKTPKSKSTGSAALYGTVQAISDRSIVSDIACGYFDLYYKATPTFK